MVTFAQRLCCELANWAVDKLLVGSVVLRKSLTMAKLLFSFLRNQLYHGWLGVPRNWALRSEQDLAIYVAWPDPPTPHLEIFEVLRQSFASFIFYPQFFLRDLSLFSSPRAEMDVR